MKNAANKMPQYSKNFNWLQIYLQIQKEAEEFVGLEGIEFVLSQAQDKLKTWVPQKKSNLKSRVCEIENLD